MRTADQISPDFMGEIEAGKSHVIPEQDWNNYLEPGQWWRDESIIKRRRKVSPPVLSRQRMHAQPMILWTLGGDAGRAVQWKPRMPVKPDDIVKIGGRVYVCGNTGITGDTQPLHLMLSINEPMAWAVWQKAGGEAEPRLPSALYKAGEKCTAGGSTWVCVQPGATRARSEPDWTGDEVEDRDYITVSPVDLSGAKVILNIGGERVEQAGPMRLTRAISGRFLLSIDSPGFYSDEVLISVENP